MTEQSDLERRYRRLLAWYPREYRRQNGQEILAVLMAGARDGQSRPGVAESADLIRHAVRLRLRPDVPRSTRTVQAAVRLMSWGAATSALGLLAGVTLLVVDPRAAVSGRFRGRDLAAQQPLLVTASAAFGLVVVCLWLWMARATGRGRNWARILSTAFFVLATPQWDGVLTRPVSHDGLGATLLYYGGVAPFLAAWLTGAAAIALLWHPASTRFFTPANPTQTGPTP